MDLWVIIVSWNSVPDPLSFNRIKGYHPWLRLNVILAFCRAMADLPYYSTRRDFEGLKGDRPEASALARRQEGLEIILAEIQK